MLHTHTACDEVDVGGAGGGSARLQTHEHTHTAYDEVDACDNIYALFVNLSDEH